METIKEKGPDLLELVVKKDLGIELSEKEKEAYTNIDSDIEEMVNLWINSEFYSYHLNIIHY